MNKEQNQPFTHKSLEEQLFLKYFHSATDHETGVWMQAIEIIEEIEKLSKCKLGNKKQHISEEFSFQPKNLRQPPVQGRSAQTTTILFSGRCIILISHCSFPLFTAHTNDFTKSVGDQWEIKNRHLPLFNHSIQTHSQR